MLFGFLVLLTIDACEELFRRFFGLICIYFEEVRVIWFCMVYEIGVSVDTYVTAVKNSCRVSMNSGKEGLGQSMKLFIRDAEINKFSNRLRAAVKGDGGTYEPGGEFAPHEAIGVHEFWVSIYIIHDASL